MLIAARPGALLMGCPEAEGMVGIVSYVTHATVFVLSLTPT